MTQFEQLMRAWAEATVPAVRDLDQKLRALAWVPQNDRPYLGNRCGWYPEKPKRRRRSRSS